MNLYNFVSTKDFLGISKNFNYGSVSEAVKF